MRVLSLSHYILAKSHRYCKWTLVVGILVHVHVLYLYPRVAVLARAMPPLARLWRTPTPGGACTAARYNISFIKIHKTGSGSFHNRLVRLAREKSLFVAVPICRKPRGIVQVFPGKAKASFFVNPTNASFRGYSMFVDHAMFDPVVQLDYMPPDVLFVTQIRHPYDQARSIFEHFRRQGTSYGEFDEFMARPHRPAKLMNFTGCYIPSGATMSLTSNFQAFTLGYQNYSSSDTADFDRHLAYLDRTLDHVSILEMKNLSDVLMKRKFCWHVKDLLDLPTHQTNKTGGYTPQVPVLLLERHKTLSTLDYRLYDHFKQKLMDEVAAQPDDFLAEVAEYMRLSAQFATFCRSMCTAFTGVQPSQIQLIRSMLEVSMEVPATRFDSAFNVTYLDCVLAMSQERALKHMLKRSHYPDACSSSDTMQEYAVNGQACMDDKAVYPGINIMFFRKKVLDTKNCQSLAYIEY